MSTMDFVWIVSWNLNMVANRSVVWYCVEVCGIEYCIVGGVFDWKCI